MESQVKDTSQPSRFNLATWPNVGDHSLAVYWNVTQTRSERALYYSNFWDIVEGVSKL